MATASCRIAAIAALVLAVACYGVSGQSPATEAAPAPGPAVNPCFTPLLNVSDCLSYVQDGSNLTKPDKACCPEVASLVDNNPICLCELLGNPESTGFKIDVNKALKLPSVCRISTPPVSTCAAVGVPVSLPPTEGSISPSSLAPGVSANSPSTAVSPAGLAPKGSGSPSDIAAASPSGNKNDNGALGIQISALPFILGLATLSVCIFF